jgi:hypothetical protein
MSVESDVVLTEHVVDDDLAGRAVWPDRRQHRTARRGKEATNRFDQTLAVGQDAK